MIKNMVLQLAELGKIKIGMKSEEIKTNKNGANYQLPEKVNYFIVTKLDKNKFDNFVKDEEIHKKIGDEPKKLDIMFVSNDIDEIFPTSYSRYEGKKEVCRGDGEVAYEINNPKVSIKCPCEKYSVTGNSSCKLYGILNCLLTEQSKNGGVYKFRTHSYFSVRNILSSLGYITNLTGGQLALIPFILELSEKHTPKGTIQMANIVYIAGNINEFLEKVYKIKEEIKRNQMLLRNITLKIDYTDDSLSETEICEEFYQSDFKKAMETEKQKSENPIIESLKNNKIDFTVETAQKNLEVKLNEHYYLSKAFYDELELFQGITNYESETLIINELKLASMQLKLDNVILQKTFANLNIEKTFAGLYHKLFILNKYSKNLVKFVDNKDYYTLIDVQSGLEY